MRFFDTPVRPLFDRTPRELILILGGLLICVIELARPQLNLWHFAVFATGTVLFAVRFFAARVVAIGVLLSAIAAHLTNQRYGTGWTQVDLFWGVYPMLGGVLLLLSRDLALRFDYAQSGPGLRLNRWRVLPRSHWRAATALGWTLGILGHFLLRAWQPVADVAPQWPLYAIIGITLCIFILFTGRSVVFIAAAIIGVAVALAVIPHIGAAQAYAANSFAATPPTSVLWATAPAFALPAAIAAIATAAIALPYAVLHVWKSLAATPR